MHIDGIQTVINEQYSRHPQNHKLQIKKLSDTDIQILATEQPKKMLQEVKKKTLYTLGIGVPLVDSALNATMTKGNLYQKVSSFAKSSVKWAGIFTVGLSVLGLKKAINNKVETLDNFDKNHPALSFGLDMAVLFTAYSLAKNGLNEINTLVKQKYPKVIKQLKTNVEKPIKTILNKSKLNNKVKAFDRYLTKKPYAKTAGLTLAITAAPLMLISTIIRQNKEINSAVKQANTNYAILNAFNNLLPAHSQKAKQVE